MGSLVGRFGWWDFWLIIWLLVWLVGRLFGWWVVCLFVRFVWWVVCLVVWLGFGG